MLSDEVICSREIDSEVSQIWIKSTLFQRFNTQQNFVWCQIYRKSVITIQIWLGLTRFRKDFYVRRTFQYTCSKHF